MYADDNDGKYPPDLKSLMPDYVDNPKLFICPSAKAAGNNSGFATSFTYLPGRVANMPGDFFLASDSNLSNHGGDGFNVLYIDAHVEWWRASRMAEFNHLLAAQEEVVRKLKADPKNLSRFIEEYRGAARGAGAPVPAKSEPVAVPTR